MQLYIQIISQIISQLNTYIKSINYTIIEIKLIIIIIKHLIVFGRSIQALQQNHKSSYFDFIRQKNNPKIETKHKMYTKEQIIQKISQISRQRSKLDDLYVALQKNVASYKADNNSNTKSVVKMRQDFNILVSEISVKIVQRNKQLDALKYRTQKLSTQGQNIKSQQRNIVSLKQYFAQLKQKLNVEKNKGEQAITYKQTWQLKVDSENISQQQTSLLNSHKIARQTNQLAEGALSLFIDQSDTLLNSMHKMGSVLKNINLAASITNMIKTRSKQDNKLILWLTIGLFLQILLCLFVIKPFFRGD